MYKNFPRSANFRDINSDSTDLDSLGLNFVDRIVKDSTNNRLIGAVIFVIRNCTSSSRLLLMSLYPHIRYLKVQFLVKAIEFSLAYSRNVPVYDSFVRYTVSIPGMMFSVQSSAALLII